MSFMQNLIPGKGRIEDLYTLVRQRDQARKDRMYNRLAGVDILPPFRDGLKLCRKGRDYLSPFQWKGMLRSTVLSLMWKMEGNISCNNSRLPLLMKSTPELG